MHGKEKKPTVNRICFYFHYHQIPKTSLCRILNKHISDVFPISWQFENSLELNIDYISLFLRIGGNVIDSNLSITYLFYKNFLKHSANDRCSTRQRKHSHTCTRASGRNMPCKNKIAQHQNTRTLKSLLVTWEFFFNSFNSFIIHWLCKFVYLGIFCFYLPQN